MSLSIAPPHPSLVATAHAPNTGVAPHPTVALQLIDVLREFGTNLVFGIPGGAIAPLYGALLERPDVKVVTAKHEAGAAFMAMGYALATGRPGVVLTTAGPGITNALSGLASAHYDGVALVHIAGEVPRSAFGRGALQEGSAAGLDAVSIARRMTKFAAQLSRPSAAAAVLRRAVTTAYSGRRGPVFLSLPLDVAATRTPVQPIFGSVRSSFDVHGPSCEQAMELLRSAQRPMILAGSGCRDQTTRRLLRRLADYLDAPVAVTTKGKGVFPEDHPLYLGVFGFGGHESVIEYLSQGVDVILACATGLNDFTSNGWSPVLHASRAFIQIDIDSGQLGKNYPTDLGLLGPADVVLSRMLENRSDQPTRKRGRTYELKTQRPPQSSRGMLSTIDVVEAMNECCPPNSVFTADMGEHLSVALHYLRVREGGEFFTCLGFGSMGSGILSAVGFQFGMSPLRRTFAICGDGGMLMFGGDVATAVQHRVPTTFVVINDARLNMVHHGMKDLYGASPDFSTQEIDFAAMAVAMGAVGVTVRTRDELRAELLREVDTARVIDVRVDPDVRLGGNQRVAALKQFREG